MRVCSTLNRNPDEAGGAASLLEPQGRTSVLRQLVQEQPDLVEEQLFVVGKPLERIFNLVADALETIAKRDIGRDFLIRSGRRFHA